MIIIKVIFIAHGGKQVGMGHIIRSLSLALAFRQEKCEVKFISKYKEGIEKIQYMGFQVYRLNTTVKQINIKGFQYGNQDDLEQEQHYISKILKKENPEVIIIDTYNVNKVFFLEVKKYVKIVAYIDDIYAFEYPVDVIINGNISATDMGYKKNNNQKHLLGLKYNLIRDEFTDIGLRIISDEITSIMITTGASDPFNMTFKFIKAILQDKILKNKILNVIIGDGFNTIEEIEKIAKINKNILLKRNVKKMSEVMLNSHIAISAGGSTVYELAACGIPMMVFAYADNQKAIIQNMEKSSLLINLGKYDKIDYELFIKQLKDLILNYEYRSSISNKLQSLVDGQGAKRVAKEILASLK